MNYQEYRQSLNQKLTNKIQGELSSFREEMQAKTPQEIYDAAYQIAMKNEIADCFSNADYSPQAVKALMNDYSCAMKSRFRKSGNQITGRRKSSLASLLA